MVNGPYKTGLNETLLVRNNLMAFLKKWILLNEGFLNYLKGIKAPFWLTDVFNKTIGYRESEKALQLGSLYSAEQALKINLVDEICTPEELFPKAEQQMQRWLKIPSIISFIMGLNEAYS